jgi:GNAT superfamily N-acetyltransferase
MRITITEGYQSGAIGKVTELHGLYYARHWGFGTSFEAKVARELAESMQRKSAGDGFWIASVDSVFAGSITIDGRHADSDGAHLRWFILTDAARGQSAGNRLMDAAMAFVDAHAYRKTFLHTFKGLDGARHLYEKHGFILVQEKESAIWGKVVSEQRFARLG